VTQQIDWSEPYHNWGGPLARKAEAKILRFGSNFNFFNRLRIVIARSVAI
jgi:hypothetical protein